MESISDELGSIELPPCSGAARRRKLSFMMPVRKDGKRLSWRESQSSMASRVENSSRAVINGNEKTRRLWVVIITLALSLGFVNGIVAIVNEFVIHFRNLEWKTKKNYARFENPYEDIIKDTIPFVQDWYRSLGLLKKNEPLLPKSTGTTPAMTGGSNGENSCLGRWLEDMQSGVAPNGTLVTSPKVIERVLASMGLLDQPLIREHLKDFLTEPQSLDFLFESTFQCLSLSRGVVQLACAAEIMYPEHLNLSTAEQKSYVLDALHVAVTIDRLTFALTDDFTSLHQVIDTMKTTQLFEVEKYVRELYSDSRFLVEFRLAKYHGLVAALQAFADAVSENKPTIGKVEALQTNILEAVKVDILLGYEENARVGIALAVSVQFEPTVEAHTSIWRLGKDWVDAYISWNMAFITGSAPMNFLQKLMIPAVSCTLDSAYGESFVASRIVALALSLMQIQRPLLSGLNIDQQDEVAAMTKYYQQQTQFGERRELASALGEANFNGLALPIPSNDAVEEMLFNLCGGKCRDGSWKVSNANPVSELNDDDFHVYLGFVLWITVLLAGFGLELLVLLSYLQDGWSSKFEVRWRFAQFLFPLLAAVSLGLALRQNFMALLVLVPGLWKFGFPETIMYMYVALYKAGDATRLQRSVEFINAVGTVVHHGAASLLISMLLAGAVKPAKYIINPILILLMQHWFVLLKYVSVIMYTVLEAILEVWFEWIIISELEKIFSNHWTAALAANCMLVAHWLYLIGATLPLVDPKSYGEHIGAPAADQKVRTKYLQSFRISKASSRRLRRSILLTPSTPKPGPTAVPTVESVALGPELALPYPDPAPSTSTMVSATTMLSGTAPTGTREEIDLDM